MPTAKHHVPNTKFPCRCRRMYSLRLLSLALLSQLCSADSIPDDPSNSRRVLHIVLDGLTARSVDSLLSDGRLPNLAKLKANGAFTDNARIDHDSSQTLPTHVSMFTGMNVEDHGIKDDKDPGTSKSINGLENIFDLVSDANIGDTCFFGSKDKFEFFERSSWSITYFDYNKDGDDTIKSIRDKMNSRDPCRYAFVHFREPDKAGHGDGPDSKEYRRAVELADDYVGQVLEIYKSLRMLDQTAIIVMPDHGFEVDSNHNDFDDPNVFTVPFFVSGPHVQHGSDLYELNIDGPYQNPGKSRPRNNAMKQPIRVNLAGMLAADFLGVGARTGPLSANKQNLKVSRSTIFAPAPTTAPTAAPSPTNPDDKISQILYFYATGMTYVNERRRQKTYGSRKLLIVSRRFRRSKQGLLKFNVNLGGPIDEIARVELLLDCTKSADSGIELFTTDSATWKQEFVTWRDAPRKVSRVGAIDSPLYAGATYSVLLDGGKNLVDADGLISLRVSTKSTRGSRFENGKLLVTYK